MSPLSRPLILNDKTVFVVGNGPSLRDVDLKLLAEHPWVGMNAAYRQWQRNGLFPTYYACLDLIVGLSHGKAIVDLVERSDSLGIKAFLLRDNLISQYAVLSESSKVINFDRKFAHLPKRIFDLVTTGSHSALWMAAMDYQQILLLGIDGSYEEKVSGAEASNQEDNALVIKKDASNSNYYFDDYQQIDDQYSVPNPLPEVHLGAWRRVKQHLDKEEKGAVKIYNGSAKSLIDICGFFDLADLTKGSAPVKSVEDTFAKRDLTSQREITQLGSIDIAILLNVLAPLRIGKVVSYTERDIAQRLKKRGWITSQTAKDFQTTAIIGDAHMKLQEMQNAGVVIVSTANQKEAVHVLKTLFAHHDTVLLLNSQNNETTLSRYPCHLPDGPAYAIAFKDKRFWRKDLAMAMNIAAQKSPEPHKIKTFCARRFFSLRAFIRRTFKS